MKIIKQAIEEISFTANWVYNEWEDGRITKYWTEYIDGFYNMGYEVEVEVKPLGLNWVDVTPKKGRTC